jgi:hypothetical protein
MTPAAPLPFSPLDTFFDITTIKKVVGLPVFTPLDCLYISAALAITVNVSVLIAQTLM